jgi:hypothetical protein
MASVMVEKMERSADVNAVSVFATVLADKPRSYYLWVNPTSVTVVYEPQNRRHLGKTYHAADDAATARELARGYKRDGDVLANLTRQARGMLAG